MASSDRLSRRILGLCARDRGHEAMYRLLEQTLAQYRALGLSWEPLLHLAEQHGMAPLLHKHLTHLGCVPPGDCQRILRSLHQRARLSGRVRNRTAAQILAACREERLEVLAIKGIALANFAYESPEWRPMRDLDLLVRKRDLDRARRLLLGLHFRQTDAPHIPADYYHLEPLVKVVDGLPVTVELHHNLLPLDGNYPPWPLDRSLDRALPIHIAGGAARTLGLEDSLHYCYLHGLRAPLSYEEFRLIHIADIVTLTERFGERIDWGRLQAQFEALPTVLSRLHYITPWPEEVIDRLRLDIGPAPGRAGVPYRGWPRRRLRGTPAREWPLLLRETLLPPQWWTQIYYGCSDRSGYLAARFREHPRTVWRWVKALWRSRQAGSS